MRGKGSGRRAPKLRRMPSIRLSLAIFFVGSAILAFLAYRGYRYHVDYCEGSPEVAAGGDSLSCLEPQHWSAALVMLSVVVLLEIALVVVVGAAVVYRRSRQVPPSVPPTDATTPVRSSLLKFAGE
jgi:hypothetical protein